MRLLYFLVLYSFLSLPSLAQSPFRITDFGAVADDKTVNTKAINEAVQACHKAGGGRVLVPVGSFLTGTVRLLSNVELYLEAGARLKGSPNLVDYQLDGKKLGLLYAYEAVNVSISGKGTVDGDADQFFDAKRNHRYVGYDPKLTRQRTRDSTRLNTEGPSFYTARPGMLVEFVRCERLQIRDVQFVNSPEWTFCIRDCDDVLVSGIAIKNNLLTPNSDGIHCTTSRNIRISDCDLRCGDDAIVVTGFNDPFFGEKATDFDDYRNRRVGNRTGKSENVVVSNCVMQSRSAGIRIGYGDNDIRNCVFQNLVIYDSNRGIGVFARDRGSIENILFQNITIQTRLTDGNWWGKGDPIQVSRTPQSKTPVGRVRNIQFSHITARSEAGITLWGEPGLPVEDVRFDQVDVTISAGPLASRWGGNIDLRPTATPTRDVFQYDMPGLLAHQVDGLQINHVSVRWAGPPAEYFTHGLVLENVTRSKIEQFEGTGAKSGFKAVQTVSR